MKNKWKLFLTALVPMAALACAALIGTAAALNAVYANQSVFGLSQDQAFNLFMTRGLILLAILVPLLAILQTFAILFLFRPTGASVTETLEDRMSAVLADKGAKDMFNSVLELYKSAVTDPDTGAVVFRHFKSMLDAEIERTRRYKVPLSIVRIRLLAKDKSKTSLNRVSVNLRSVLRNVDIVSIDPGKDFVALLPHTKKNNAEMAVWRVWKRVKSVEEQTDVRIPLAAGIATFGEDGEQADVLLEKAEENCRRAATFGPGKVVF